MTNESRAPFEGRRTIHRYTQVINAAPDAVFPLICPVREGEWAHGWVGRPVFAPSGLAEENGVYATEHGEAEPTIWLVTRRDPVRHETEFVYFVPRKQVVRLTIGIRAAGSGRSNVSIHYVRTGISEEGNTFLAESERTGAFESMVRGWEEAMNHYFATGEILERAH